MELYDDYENGNIDSLIEFANKTFPKDGTDKFFIGCTLILFDNSNGFKGRYYASRENLFFIVMSAKEKIGTSNLLAFYIDRINDNKLVNKYLKDVVNDKTVDKYADLVIEYLEQFKPKFICFLKKHKSLDKYIKKIDDRNVKEC